MADHVGILNVTGGVPCEERKAAGDPLRLLLALIGRRSPALRTRFRPLATGAVFLHRTRRMLRVVDRLRAWRVAGERRSRAVLSLRAGRTSGGGDVLAVRPAADASGPTVLSGEQPRASLRPLPPPEQEDFHTEPLSPVRVMVVARDRRFRSLASTLLTHRGCEVSVCAGESRVLERAALERAQVVVIDAGHSLTEAARMSAALQALSPPVGAVLVADEEATGLSNLPVLPRWGPFEVLYGAVMAARRDRPGGGALVGPARRWA